MTLTQLPKQLIEQLGLGNTHLIRVDHTNSPFSLWLGGPHAVADRIVPENATVTVFLERTRPSFYDHTYSPDAIHLAGINPARANRPIALSYQLRNPSSFEFDPKNAVRFLDEINVAVTQAEVPEADPSDREGRTPSIPTPTQYYRDIFTAGLITYGMIPRLPSFGALFPMVIRTTQQYALVGSNQFDSEAGTFTFTGMGKYDNKELVTVSFIPSKETGLDAGWQVQVPAQLNAA